MQSAAFALVVNIAIAALFAISFAVIALINPARRAVYGFSLSYATGMLTPISELLLPFQQGTPAPFMIASYFSFLTGLLIMTAALARFYGRPVPWAAIGATFAGAVVLRWLLWGGERDSLSYELAFQAPFAVASLLPGLILLRAGRRGPLEIAAGLVFTIIALHFLTKPFLAAAFGSGPTARDYITSLYALLSQASTGILLTAAGLLILLITVQAIVTESRDASETDTLSGLANRRGFDLHSARALARARAAHAPVAVAMFDIDHFKAINDNHGHAAGDKVIRDFADLLRRHAPRAAVIGRLGGEEFALLFCHVTEEEARLNAEAIRIAAAQPTQADSPAFTVSGGLSAVRPDDLLAEAMRRADMALYKAKQSGRNRICVAGTADGPPAGPEQAPA